jgi:hypothetical protein
VEVGTLVLCIHVVLNKLVDEEGCPCHANAFHAARCSQNNSYWVLILLAFPEQHASKNLCRKPDTLVVDERNGQTAISSLGAILGIDFLYISILCFDDLCRLFALVRKTSNLAHYVLSHGIGPV